MSFRRCVLAWWKAMFYGGGVVEVERCGRVVDVLVYVLQ